MNCGIPVPGPSEAFTTVFVKHSDVPVWFHVYSNKNYPTRADSFAKGWGDTEPLTCVSFHTPYLPALQNLTRAQLIDSLPACYEETRAWSRAAYLQRPEAQAVALLTNHWHQSLGIQR